MSELLTLKEASKWATEYLKKEVEETNILYLISYGKILKYDSEGSNESISNGDARVKLSELKKYYDKFVKTKADIWKDKLGDVDWNLSFDNLREKDTTKHVHRLHPYKGKFIPQLVEYFLDTHTDEFKKDTYFRKGSIVLDPFMGSGTTLVQASEMEIHSIGIDISKFNCLIAKVKTNRYDLDILKKELAHAVIKTKMFSESRFDESYNINLKCLLSNFNNLYFQSPEYKIKVSNGIIDEKTYSKEKLDEFYNIFDKFNKENRLIKKVALIENKFESREFIDKWYNQRVKEEILFYISLIDEIKNESLKNLMKVIISRTARSCRATTHSDLATLKEPIYIPYYCTKHFKICIPIQTIVTKLTTYSKDTIKRIEEFSKLRKNVSTEIIHSDSRITDIFKEIELKNPELYKMVKEKGIDGIFTSPPYLGHIDYHEQHAYAYEFFKIERRDEDEIGALYKGTNKKAAEDYINGISSVLLNVKRFLKKDANIFIVANDNLNLYPPIAEKSGLKIIQEFKRPVLNRTERAKQPYAEKIFYMKQAL